MIKASHDPEADEMFIWLAPETAKSAETREVAPGVMRDFDATRRLIGIEVVDVRSRVAGGWLVRCRRVIHSRPWPR